MTERTWHKRVPDLVKGYSWTGGAAILMRGPTLYYGCALRETGGASSAGVEVLDGSFTGPPVDLVMLAAGAANNGVGRYAPVLVESSVTLNPLGVGTLVGVFWLVPLTRAVRLEDLWDNDFYAQFLRG